MPKEAGVDKDIFAAKWTQLRGKIRERWGKLTDNDLDQVHGRWEQMVGLLQERYAYTRERAESELGAFLEKVFPKVKA